MCPAAASRTERLDIFGKQRSALRWNGGSRRCEVVITDVWGCWIIACSLGWFPQSSHLKNTNISNRPLCMWIHSPTSSGKQKHQQFYKGHSPTENTLSSRAPKTFLEQVWLTSQWSKFKEELRLMYILCFFWPFISGLFDRHSKFLLSLQNVLSLEAAWLSDQSREKTRNLEGGKNQIDKSSSEFLLESWMIHGLLRLVSITVLQQ